MPDHAGFAVAITTRERVLNDSILLSYHGSEGDHQLAASIPGGPPSVDVDFFLEPPRIRCEGVDPRSFVVALAGWGPLGVEWNGIPYRREIRWAMRLRVRATFVLGGTEITLSPDSDDVTAEDWTFSILSGSPFPADLNSYLRSGLFRNRMQAAATTAISAGLLGIPPIDVGFLGSIVDEADMEAGAQVVDGAIVLGLDVNADGVHTSGDRDLLWDFAGPNDLATAINPAAVRAMMRDAEQQVRDEVAKQDATLEDFDITVDEGRFRITGLASNSYGSLSFSLSALPVLFDGLPGAYLPFPKRTMVIKAKIWPALAFRVADVSVSVDRASWVILVEAIGALLTGAVIPLIIEDLVRQVTQQVTTGTQNAPKKEPVPRIRWLEPIVAGDPAVRVEITEFEVHTTGVFTGVIIRPQAQPPGMLGLTSIPRDVAGDALQYRVRLPLELLQEDPKLRIRWTIIDLDTGVTVRNEDGPADGRLTLEFVPALTGAGTTKFGISVRVYRTLGPEITEFLNEGIRLEVRAPNPPGTYVRWRYDVKNPQVRFDQDRDAWWYGSPSEAVMGRWSAIHRLDKPCRMANKRSRYTYDEERLDRLPFPLWQILDRRDTVCEYCFFGGPGKLLPFL